MKSDGARTLLAGVLVVSLAILASGVHAGPGPRPPNANQYGKGYAELTAAWLEWTVAVPASTNPILDLDGANAAAGQSGKVWFLTGTLGGAATRSFTIPAGTALFFPIVNFFWVNTPEYGDPDWSPEQEASVRELMAATVDTAQNLTLEIDGRSVSNLDNLRVSGAVGACTLPDDNIFGIPFDPVVHQCVADGYWVLLSPLSVGNHTIHFAGGFESGFSLDVTYHITVSPH
jgi:hypothetical protein